MDQGLARILKNQPKQVELNEEGFTIFPFLDDSDIKTLTEYFFSVQKELPERFYSSTHSIDPEFRIQTSDFIRKTVSHKVEDQCINYKLLGGAFVVKPPRGKGLLPPHQDWNIVDEDFFRSYNLWIPLVDVVVENGAVHVLQKSHRRMPTFRGPGIDSSFKDIDKEVWMNLTPLDMKAGEALLYDHALLHASPVNQTESVRLGIVCGIIPAKANMQMYFKNGDGVSTYKVTEEFFLQHDPMQGPADLTNLTKNFVYPDQLSLEQFNTIFMERAEKKSGWFNRLFVNKS